MNRLKGVQVALLLLAMAAGACNLQFGTPSVTAVPTIMQGTTVVSSATPTSPAPSATAIVSNPTAIPPTVLAASSTPTTLRVKLALMAVNDNGQSGKKIGCGDSVVMVDRDVPRTGAPLKDTLTLLFSLKQRDYGQSGLYNALYQSDLKVDGISSDNGVFRVNLSGKVALGGACDGPRFEAQIRETIMQFGTVRQANVFINGVPLEKVITGA
ncbi:MAG: GerMN domain-containing protein [Anaerolineae bacterium]|nr:GerMN domain-containing protein [Anaerolineae bacterium]